jgi:hypothetical protein
MTLRHTQTRRERERERKRERTRAREREREREEGRDDTDANFCVYTSITGRDCASLQSFIAEANAFLAISTFCSAERQGWREGGRRRRRKRRRRRRRCVASEREGGKRERDWQWGERSGEREKSTYTPY